MLRLESSHHILFALILNLFMPGFLDEVSFQNITRNEWTKIREMAITQGLSGVCLDSFERLPTYNSPNLAVLLP